MYKERQTRTTDLRTLAIYYRDNLWGKKANLDKETYENRIGQVYSVLLNMESSQTAQFVVRVINLLKAANLPILFSEIPDEELSITGAKTALARLELVSGYMYESLLPLLYDESTIEDFTSENPDCSKCIAACCQGMDAGLSNREFMMLAEAGLVSHRSYCDVFGRFDEQILSKAIQNQGIIPSVLIPGDNMVISNFADRVNTEWSGYCGYVDKSDFSCLLYTYRPITCRTFQMGGDACRDLYVPKDSKRARRFLEVVNAAEPYLEAISNYFGAERKKGKYVIPLQKS